MKQSRPLHVAFIPPWLSFSTAYLDALHRTPELVRGFLEKILAPKQEHTINVPQRNRKRGQDMEL